jgi:hypothetical protein
MSQDLTLPEYRCALSPGVLEPANLLRKGLNWLTHHLSRGCKNPGSKVIQLKMLHQTRELESTLPMTNVQSLEVQNKMIFMGHQISSCHNPVVGSFFIYSRSYHHLEIVDMITFQNISISPKNYPT